MSKDIFISVEIPFNVYKTHLNDKGIKYTHI